MTIYIEAVLSSSSWATPLDGSVLPMKPCALGVWCVLVLVTRSYLIYYSSVVLQNARPQCVMNASQPSPPCTTSQGHQNKLESKCNVHTTDLVFEVARPTSQPINLLPTWSKESTFASGMILAMRERYKEKTWQLRAKSLLSISCPIWICIGDLMLDKHMANNGLDPLLVLAVQCLRNRLV